MVFKCKMCGGDITPKEGSNVGQCNYCKSVMTLPNLDNEKIINLYNRANFLRISNDFDRAKGIYESILELNNNETEAHWGIILCKYGVEYIDDPKTKKKVPTCHRTIESPVFEDSDFKFIKEQAYGEALELYKSEAKQINDIQKGILEISRKEQAYDIFICYKETDDNGERTYDSVLAQNIYDNLIKEGYKVFFSRITLEDKLGSEYEPYIFSALSSAKVMLVVGTSEKNLTAVWVKNEWSRYLEFIKKDRKKILIPVYSKMDAYELPDSFSMFQGQNMDKIGAMQDLITGINKIIKKDLNKELNGYDIPDDLLQKFKKMVEENERQEEIKKREIERIEEENRKKNERFQISAIVETPHISYIIISIILSVIMAIIMYTCITSSAFYKGYMDSLKLTFRNQLPDIVQFYVGIIIIIAFILGLVSRQSNKVSKYFYFSAILLEIYVFIKTYSLDYRMTIPFFVIIALNIILILLKPKWKLKSGIIESVSGEERDRIEKENKRIEENFTPKDKGLTIKPIFLVIIFISLIGMIALNQQPIKSQGNSRNETVMQLKIDTDYINIREKANIYSKAIGKVYKNEFYTILSQSKNYNSTWYKIENNRGLTGWISSGPNNDYIKIYNAK